LKFAEIFVNCWTIHLWGKKPQSQKFQLFLCNHADSTRGGMYGQILDEVHGDWSVIYSRAYECYVNHCQREW
jgi:hypothetical protein